jgi:hypothetical protein
MWSPFIYDIMVIGKEGQGMEQVIVKVTPLPGFLLTLQFQNGSIAVVNMEKRVNTLRFSRLVDPAFFATAKASGDHIIWSDGKHEVKVTCDELLDAMMMD